MTGYSPRVQRVVLIEDLKLLLGEYRTFRVTVQ